MTTCSVIGSIGVASAVVSGGSCALAAGGLVLGLLAVSALLLVLADLRSGR